MIYTFISMIENEDDRDLATFLYETNRQMVYKMAMGYLKNSTRAEDAVCDVFLRVCQSIAKFRGLECNKQSSLIVVYSRNILRNILRRDKIIAFEVLDEETASQDEQTEDFAVGQDSYEYILEAFNSLDEKYADVCKLKYYVGLSDTEIAETLAISHENVRVRLHRSKEMVRKLLTKEGVSI